QGERVKRVLPSVSPFAGLGFLFDILPRAALRLPWAIICRAFSPARSQALRAAPNTYAAVRGRGRRSAPSLPCAVCAPTGLLHPHLIKARTPRSGRIVDRDPPARAGRILQEMPRLQGIVQGVLEFDHVGETGFAAEREGKRAVNIVR